MHRTVARCARLVLATLPAMASIAIAGCSDPYASAREKLSETDRARFDRGARAALPCAACHDLAGTATKIGPPLRGLAGKRAGAVPGYAYSPALANSGVIWGPRTLDAFLASPQAFVPGTRMVSPGVADAQRADLVFFLLSAGPPD
jgi:cytochrome c